MKILVTGGAGFIGSNLAEALVKDGHEVVVLDNYMHGHDDNIASIRKDVTVVKGSITDYELVRKLSRGCDFVFNQAAAPSSPMFMKDLRACTATNVDGFVNILNAARENNVRRVIYASTSSIYGNNRPPLTESMPVGPVNFYSTTKLLNEHYATLFSANYGLETVGFRYFSVYGPHEEHKGPGGVYANLVSQFLWSMKKGQQPVIYGDGKQTRDFTYVKDVCQANVLAMKSRKQLLGEVFNVAAGKAVSFNSLVNTLGVMLGRKIKPKYIKTPVKNYIGSQQVDLTKITRALGYRPQYTLERGIAEMTQKPSFSRIGA